jgi:hypothetical protein
MGYLNQYGLRHLLGLLKNYIGGPIKDEIKDSVNQELLSLYFAEEDLSIDNRKIIYTTEDPFPLNIDAGREIISNTFNANTGEGIITYGKAVRKINSIEGSVVKISLPKTTKVLPKISLSTLIGIDGDGSLLSYSFSGATSLQYVMPKLLSIPDYAFEDCSSLTSVTIGDSVTTIGYEAFKKCTSLTSITIPDSVTTIGDDAFQSCYSLKSVTIGDSVTTIGGWAFSDCHSLTSVYCKAVTPPVGGSSIFSNNASNRKIYVPMGSVGAYKSAWGWSSYSTAIVGYNFD